VLPVGVAVGGRGPRRAGGPGPGDAPGVQPGEDGVQAVERAVGERLQGVADDLDEDADAALSGTVDPAVRGELARGGHGGGQELGDVAGHRIPHQVDGAARVGQAVRDRVCGPPVRVAFAHAPDGARCAAPGTSSEKTAGHSSGCGHPSGGPGGRLSVSPRIPYITAYANTCDKYIDGIPRQTGSRG